MVSTVRVLRATRRRSSRLDGQCARAEARAPTAPSSRIRGPPALKRRPTGRWTSTPTSAAAFSAAGDPIRQSVRVEHVASRGLVEPSEVRSCRRPAAGRRRARSMPSARIDVGDLHTGRGRQLLGGEFAGGGGLRLGDLAREAGLRRRDGGDPVDLRRAGGALVGVRDREPCLLVGVEVGTTVCLPTSTVFRFCSAVCSVRLTAFSAVFSLNSATRWAALWVSSTAFSLISLTRRAASSTAFPVWGVGRVALGWVLALRWALALGWGWAFAAGLEACGAGLEACGAGLAAWGALAACGARLGGLRAGLAACGAGFLAACGAGLEAGGRAWRRAERAWRRAESGRS